MYLIYIANSAKNGLVIASEALKYVSSSNRTQLEQISSVLDNTKLEIIDEGLQ